jgi:hypothetical protein
VSAIDSPDHVRGAAPASQQVINVAGGIAATTFDLPLNATVLWIFATGTEIGTPLKVVGITSGVSYPTFEVASNNLDTNDRSHVAYVSQQTDPTVTVTWATAPTGAWFIVAVSGGSVSVDPALAGSIAPPATPSPGWGVQVAGTDGTDLRVLLTDNTGKLMTTGGSFPPVYAAPGTANPADALAVGGTDGTDLRVILTDSSGHVLSIDQVLKLAVAPLGAAIPADAVMVAGTDGVSVYALSTDTVGRLQTQDINLFETIAPPGTAAPVDAVQVAGTDGTDLRVLFTNAAGELLTVDQVLAGVTTILGHAIPGSGVMMGGSDGTDLRALRTDQRGIPYAIPSAPDTATGDRPPTELLWASNTSTAVSVALVPAPGAGKRIRVFFINAFAITGTASYFIQCPLPGGTTAYPIVSESPAGATPPAVLLPLTGLLLDTNAQVTLGINAGNAGATIAYTIETV